MKRCFYFRLLFMICIHQFSWAQQKPHYTQYLQNQYVINPALSGIENYLDIRLSHRQQWVGVQDAPMTSYFSAHAALNKSDYRTTATSFKIPDDNPRGHDYWERYTAASPHHGIGMQVINDVTGPLRFFSAYATYAFHVGITSKTNLAAGFGAGINKVSLNTAKLNFGTLNPIDPVIDNSGVLNSYKPDFMAGLYLYSADYFVGLSAQQILSQPLEFSDNIVRTINGKTVPHLFMTAGYRFFLSEDLNLTPSLMVKKVMPSPIQYDLNVKLQYWDRAWIAASYRWKEGYAAMMGFNVSGKFNLGYSYDISYTKLSTISKGTHELIIGFLLFNDYGDWYQKRIW